MIVRTERQSRLGVAGSRYRGCCCFDTFLEAFMAGARRYGVPLILVDRLQARRHWRTGLTGQEALVTQRRVLLQESEHLR